MFDLLIPTAISHRARLLAFLGRWPWLLLAASAALLLYTLMFPRGWDILAATAIIAYPLGFFLLAFLRRWLWLLLVASSALLFCAWAFVAVQNIEGDNFRYGYLFGTVAITFLICGLAAGFLFRVGVLKSRRLQQEGPRAVFGVAVFVLVPALFCGTVYGSYRIRENLRAPTLACASGLHQATLGDMRLGLPMAPNLVVETKQAAGPAEYWFDVPENITRFCALAATAPPELVSVNLQTEITVANRSTWFCAERRDYDWWQIACPPDRGRKESGFPAAIYVFLIEKSRYTFYARPHEELKRIQAGERPLIQAADGFRRYGKNDWSFSYISDDDTSYIAECEGGKITKSAYMSCTVARELAPNIGMTYRFGATDDTFAARARSFDAKATALIASLKAPDGVPSPPGPR
jgi:hypothetical protein